MSLDRLAEQVDSLGPGAFLITVAARTAKGHVVSVLVGLEDTALVTEAGRTSQANLGSNPRATLLWPPTGDGPYSLIVDGTADLGPSDRIAVRPERAVLHRVAGTSTDTPSCVPLENHRLRGHSLRQVPQLHAAAISLAASPGELVDVSITRSSGWRGSDSSSLHISLRRTGSSSFPCSFRSGDQTRASRTSTRRRESVHRSCPFILAWMRDPGRTADPNPGPAHVVFDGPRRSAGSCSRCAARICRGHRSVVMSDRESCSTVRRRQAVQSGGTRIIQRCPSGSATCAAKAPHSRCEGS